MSASSWLTKRILLLKILEFLYISLSKLPNSWLQPLCPIEFSHAYEPCSYAISPINMTLKVDVPLTPNAVFITLHKDTSNWQWSSRWSTNNILGIMDTINQSLSFPPEKVISCENHILGGKPKENSPSGGGFHFQIVPDPRDLQSTPLMWYNNAIKKR